MKTTHKYTATTQYMNIEANVMESSSRNTRKIKLNNVSSGCGVSDFHVENALIKELTGTTECLRGAKNFVVGIGVNNKGPFHFRFDFGNVYYLQSPIISSLNITGGANSSLLLDFSNITIKKAWAEVKDDNGNTVTPQRIHSLSLHKE